MASIPKNPNTKTPDKLILPKKNATKVASNKINAIASEPEYKFIFLKSYLKKGTPFTAYFLIPSSLISTPMPGFSDNGIKPFSVIGPSK